MLGHFFGCEKKHGNWNSRTNIKSYSSSHNHEKLGISFPRSLVFFLQQGYFPLSHKLWKDNLHASTFILHHRIVLNGCTWMLIEHVVVFCFLENIPVFQNNLDILSCDIWQCRIESQHQLDKGFIESPKLEGRIEYPNTCKKWRGCVRSIWNALLITLTNHNLKLLPLIT